MKWTVYNAWCLKGSWALKLSLPQIQFQGAPLWALCFRVSSSSQLLDKTLPLGTGPRKATMFPRNLIICYSLYNQKSTCPHIQAGLTTRSPRVVKRQTFVEDVGTPGSKCICADVWEPHRAKPGTQIPCHRAQRNLSIASLNLGFKAAVNALLPN